jgi:glutamate:GABA antiporter
VKYADRYENEDFWRIPGGKPGVWVTCIIGIASTLAGIYYSFATSWLPDVPNSTWMTWLGGIVIGTLVVMGLVFFFGRRSAAKLNQQDALAHLAKLDLTSEAPEAV